MGCKFCAISQGSEAASIVYEDEFVMAFMSLQPARPGECLIIPRQHVDHFTDLDDQMASRIMVLAQRIGRKMREEFRPERIGMVVHGFGVPHAHLIVVPQYDPNDITSARFASVEGGNVVFDLRKTPEVERAVLDAQAARLKLVPEA